MNKVHVKTGDTVVVLNGKERGKKGKILAVSPKEGKVIIEGVNMVSKHVKPRRMGDTGGIVKAEGAMYASKVQIVCPAAASPPVSVISFMKTAPRNAFAKNAASRCKED